jgi:hypothetical protein
MHPDRHQTVGRNSWRRIPDVYCATDQVDDIVVRGRAVPHRYDAFHPEHLRRWIFEKVEQCIGVNAASAADGDGIRMDVVVLVVVVDRQV